MRASMLTLTVLGMLLWAGGSLAQVPAPCVTPPQFTARCTQVDQGTDQVNRYYLAYDALNKRRALIEEQNVVSPGKQFREFLMLANENMLYEINLTKKTCTKSAMRRPWRPFAIPANATFEDEFYVGGPGEEVYAQEWSDRIPLRKREYWIGVFSLKNCYPMSEVLVADYLQLNSTISTSFYDLVQGIPDPNVFIPPPECLKAPWARPSRMGPFA